MDLPDGLFLVLFRSCGKVLVHAQVGMMTTQFDDRIRCTVTVPLPIAHAFDLFVNGFGRWWPVEYTWSQDVLETIVIEARLGGRCYEQGPHGFICDWGRVLAWDPPHRLRFSWQISPTREPVPNPAKASAVDVRFTQLDPLTTSVDLEHRDFARHGNGAAEYLAALASSQGWPWILDQFVNAAFTAR